MTSPSWFVELPTDMGESSGMTTIVSSCQKNGYYKLQLVFLAFLHCRDAFASMKSKFYDKC